MDLSVMGKRLTTRQGIETLPELVNADLALVGATIETVKRLCTQLRPPLLDHLGLGAALEWQAEDFQKRNAIECVVNLVPADMTVDEKYSTSLFRIFQESLTNVLRHAKATKVTATLSDKGGSIILVIADNGVGITTENLAKANSFGLLGMRDRLQQWRSADNRRSKCWHYDNGHNAETVKRSCPPVRFTIGIVSEKRDSSNSHC
jgi:signal transduction histidine kinase